MSQNQKYQDIRAYTPFGQTKDFGVFVQFEIQSNSIQIIVNLIDSNSSNESKNKNSKNPKSIHTFGHGIIFGENNSKSFFVKLVQPK